VGVITPPAKPFGRKLILKDPPLATFAKERGLHLIQTKNVNDPVILSEIKQLGVDVAITAAFGQILGTSFLATPKRAVINIHPSLLPKYRGATPVQSSLLDKLTVTGVTILFTVKELDAGAIICQVPSSISPGEKAPELTDRLFKASADPLLESLIKLRDPNFAGQNQDPTLVTYCKKIQKADGLIDWSRPSEDILAAYRAFAGWPGIYTFFETKRINFLDLTLHSLEEISQRFPDKITGQKPGHFFFDRKLKALVVLTVGGFLQVKQLQPEGGKTIDGAAFWNGIKDKEKLHYFV
jgi:methionyl-tRNA formyltransferase